MSIPDELARFIKYLIDCERSPLTIKNYQCDLQAFYHWFTQNNNSAMLTPIDVTATDLREYKQWLTQNLKPSSVNRKLAALRSFLHWANETELITSNVKMPKMVRLESVGPQWLSRREQNALLRTIERGGKERDIAIVKILLNTGLRVDELCALEWRDIKISERAGLLTVRSGKHKKRREIPLNKDARNAFYQIGYQQQAGKTSAIFIGQRGKLTPRGIQRLLNHYDLTISPHTLRHTFCKNLVEAGVGLEKIAALAGHENLNTTRRYLTPSIKDLTMACELISTDE